MGNLDEPAISPAWGRLRRWFHSVVSSPVPPLEAPPKHLVDAHTRTFWSRGAAAPTTLVEAEAPATVGHRGRVAALIDRHERGAGAARPGRPRANPAFSEAVFVELMRARRYARAFDLLAPECRRRWTSADAFAQAQAGGALRHLQGARVEAVRYLDDWTDPDSGATYRHVAELDVEYTLDNGHRRAVITRTVHLVGFNGQWHSLCYPEPVGVSTAR